MEKHNRIYNSVIYDLKSTPNVHGVLLNGSLAYGKATEYSDIDLIVLSDKDEFISKRVDGILVEEHFHTYERMIDGLERNPQDVYKYLYSKIVFDDGRLFEITKKAKILYDNYETPSDVKEGICYWLSSTKDKINGAISAGDLLKASYLVSTNAWEILKGVWAANNKPMPPTAITFSMRNILAEVPFENWFASLFEGTTLEKANSAIQIIGWICASIN